MFVVSSREEGVSLKQSRSSGFFICPRLVLCVWDDLVPLFQKLSFSIFLSSLFL